MTRDNLPYEKVGKNDPVCIADEVPFEIPDSWEWVRLSTLSSVVTKGTTPRGGNVAYLDSGIGFLRAENVAGFDYLDTSNMNYIDETTHNGYLKRSILEPNDILITIAGTLGRTAIVKKDSLPLNVNQAVSIVRLTDANKLDIYFIICALNSPIIQKRLTLQKKITAIPNLTLEIISDCIIPVPPLEEQHRIVKAYKQFIPFFNDYETTEKQLQDLNLDFSDILKKSILQQAVMGKLVPQDPNDEPASVLLERIRAEKQALIKEGKLKKDKHESIIYRRDNSHYEKVDNVEHCIDDEIPFDIPDNWTWTRFDAGTLYTTDYVANGSFASLRENVKTYKDPNYAIMIKTQDFANGFSHDLTYTDKAGFEFLSKSELHGGELMLSNIGASIGKAFIIPVLDCPMTLAPNAIVVKCINETMTLFIKYLMLSFYGQQVLKDFTAGTAMPKFSKTQLRNTLIPLPPIEEQKRILIQIETLFSYVDTL